MYSTEAGVSPCVLTALSKLPAPVRAGFQGSGVRLCQIEFALFDDHESLARLRPTLRKMKPTWGGSGTDIQDAFKFIRMKVHATAVASIIADVNYGISPKAEFSFIGSVLEDWPPISLKVFDTLLRSVRQRTYRQGDIISISMQSPLVTAEGKPCYVPLDMEFEVAEVIAEITNKYGVLVFIAAGNSSLDLDAYSWKGNSYRALHERSRAILVGYTNNERTHLLRSNHGALVETYAPAQSVKAACYNFSTEDERGDLLEAFSAGFTGTSAATPMVAAMAACVQGAYKKENRGKVLGRDQMLELFRDCGYQSAAMKVGVFPDVRKITSKIMS
jgi:subtilisin family serine protease